MGPLNPRGVQISAFVHMKINNNIKLILPYHHTKKKILHCMHCNVERTICVIIIINSINFIYLFLN